MRKWESIAEYSDIKFEFFEGIAKISINRPKYTMPSDQKPTIKCWKQWTFAAKGMI